MWWLELVILVGNLSVFVALRFMTKAHCESRILALLEKGLQK